MCEYEMLEIVTPSASSGINSTTHASSVINSTRNGKKSVASTAATTSSGNRQSGFNPGMHAAVETIHFGKILYAATIQLPVHCEFRDCR